MATKTTTQSEGIFSFPIVKVIMNLLKMDDAGQISKFFEKEVKRLKTDIKTLEGNKTVVIMDRDRKIEALNDSLEDAKQNLEDAKLLITVEDVKNNAAIDYFRDNYWQNIYAKRNAIDQLEKQLVNTTKDFEEKIERIDKQIANKNLDIDMITK